MALRNTKQWSIQKAVEMNLKSWLTKTKGCKSNTHPLPVVTNCTTPSSSTCLPRGAHFHYPHPLPPVVFHCPPLTPTRGWSPKPPRRSMRLCQVVPSYCFVHIIWYARCWAMQIFDTFYSPDLLNSRQSQTPCQKACVDTCPLLMYSNVGNGNEHDDGGCWPYWAPIYLCITIGPWLLDL